jgi:hypothetical protein
LSSGVLTIELFQMLQSDRTAVAASAAMTLATYVAQLDVALLAQLPTFMPQLVALLSQNGAAVSKRSSEERDLVHASVVSSLTVILATLPTFVAPYLAPVMTSALGLLTSSAAGAVVLERVQQMFHLLPAAVPGRFLLPTAFSTYRQLVKAGTAATELVPGASELLQLLGKTFDNLPPVGEFPPCPIRSPAKRCFTFRRTLRQAT